MKKPAPLNKDDFAKLLMDRIRQEGENAEIIYNPEEYCLLRVEGGWIMTTFLSDVYKNWCAAENEGREGVIKTSVWNWFTMVRSTRLSCRRMPSCSSALRSKTG